MAKKIYLMRHGESDGDVKNLFGGAFDDNATEKAKKEANLLISKLKELKIDAIVSSPYKRAKQVAEIFAKELNLPLEVIEEIRERNSYGIFSGQNKDEVRRKYPEIYGMMAFVAGKKNYLFTPEKAETYDDFCLRMDDAINKIKSRPHENVLVVTHGGVISCIMREKMGRELNGASELKDFVMFESKIKCSNKKKIDDNSKKLDERRKREIAQVVKRVFDEYGEVIERLGRE